MKRHTGLFARIPTLANLLLAARQAARGKRERPSVARFEFHLERELLVLQEELLQARYRPGAFFTFEIADPKRRRICAAPYRDRVVHHAICHVLAPRFEQRLIVDTYACRPGKGTHAAIARAQQFARRYRYFLQCDIRTYFASVDHTVLQALLTRMFKEPALLALLQRIITHAPPDAIAGKGLPIGNLTSQYFANVYLGVLDHYLKESLRIKGYLRYMDDLLLFADDKVCLHVWLADMRHFLRERLRLELKEQVTRIAPVTEGIPFLGFRIYPGVLRLERRTVQRLRRRVHGSAQAYGAARLSMEALMTSMTSLFAHVAHADTLHVRRDIVHDVLHVG